MECHYVNDVEVAGRITSVRGYRDWRRLEREGCLIDPGPATVQALLVLIDRQSNVRRIREAGLSFAFMAMLSLPLAWLFKAYWFLPIIAIVPMMCTGGLSAYMVTAVQRGAVEAVASAATLSDLVIILDALDLPGQRAKSVATEAISRVLMQTPSEQFAELPVDVRNRVYLASTQGAGNIAATAISLAEQTRDIHALKYVRQIAESRATSHARDRKVRTAARRCASMLEALLDGKKAQSNLLRPADGSDISLLRPAGSSTTNDRLLQAVELDEQS